MVTEVLSKRVLDYILNDIEFTISRLGISATLSLEERENYKHQKYEVLVSSSFQTMPVLFKKIHIEGDITVKDKEGAPDYYLQVRVSLCNYYTLLNGGSNGSELGCIVYEVDKEYNRRVMVNEKSGENYDIPPQYYVEKIHTLEI